MGGINFRPLYLFINTFLHDCGGGLLNFFVILQMLAKGMIPSIAIFGLTLILSLPLGLAVSFGRMSKAAPFRCLEKTECKYSSRTARFKPAKLLIKTYVSIIHWIARFKPAQLIMKIYISIMRGTPLMLQLMFVYYGPWYIFHIKISNNYQFWAVIIAFVVNYAAYFAEIYRSGIESMPVGQYEAAEVLGYGKAQAFFKIILPQVIKHILPSVTNELITLVKDTSLAFVIAYSEMFTVAKQLSAKESSVIPFLGAAIFYYVFNLIVAMVMEKAENKMSYYQ